MKTLVTLKTGQQFITYGSKAAGKVNGRFPGSNKVVWIKAIEVDRTIPSQPFNPFA